MARDRFWSTVGTVSSVTAQITPKMIWMGKNTTQFHGSGRPHVQSAAL